MEDVVEPAVREKVTSWLADWIARVDGQNSWKASLDRPPTSNGKTIKHFIQILNVKQPHTFYLSDSIKIDANKINNLLHDHLQSREIMAHNFAS